MIKIALVGNPNVGKSLLFSRLTGVKVISSNYAGTTVEVRSAPLRCGDSEYTIFDLSGLYSLDACSKADETALAVINDCDSVINVVDATNLERNLGLTLQLLDKNIPLIVCLNFWDDTAHRGITIDAPELGRQLGVPVIPASALSGAGIGTLAAAICRAARPQAPSVKGDPWERIGRIVGSTQKLEHRHHTFSERLSDFTIHPAGGIVSAIVILGVTFLIIRYIGEWLVNGVFDPLYSDWYGPMVLSWGNHIPVAMIRDMVIGHTVDPLESFGILTTGVYISLVTVFPYFVSFYLILGILEDSGYLPRLAVVLDGFFHRLGLHGYSAIPIMLGLGCKVPALMATRMLTAKRDKVLTTALILMCAPCLPQSAMIFSLGMQHGAMTVIAIFVILLVFSLFVNTILNRLMKGDVAEMFVDIPHYRRPRVRMMARKIWLRVIEYFREVVPMIVAGVLVIHILDALQIIHFISVLVGKPLAWLLGMPGDIAPVLVLGFLRKDVSIALLAPFSLNSHQFIIASIFMVLYVPCIASFFTLVRELGGARGDRGPARGVCSLSRDFIPSIDRFLCRV